MPAKKEWFHPDITQIQTAAADSGESISPDDPSYDWRFLAEGDSWFTIGAIPSSNLLFDMPLEKRTVILNLGYPGDTLLHMSELTSNFDLVRRLSHPNWLTAWDAILVSAGGNDLIDQFDDIVVAGKGRKPRSYVNDAALAALVSEVGEGFQRMVALRDSNDGANANKPIVAHTYDYPTPRPSPATFVGVPITASWLYPVFTKLGIGEKLAIAITDFLLDALADAIVALEETLPGFHVVDTRDTLVRAAWGAKGNSGDWLNEIHPTSGGYRKIAIKLARKLNRILA